MLKGVRTFELRRRIDGSTCFTMQECFSGLMLPLAKRSMPDFGPVFERYADDLKREAERLALVVRINLRGERVDARALSRGQV